MNKARNEARNIKWLQLYNSGISIAAIANLYNCTYANVYAGLKRAGADCSGGKRGRKSKPEPTGETCEFKTIIMHGSVLVLRSFKRQTNEVPQPNFLNSGMALCAVLREGETVEQLIEKFNSKKLAV